MLLGTDASLKAAGARFAFGLSLALNGVLLSVTSVYLIVFGSLLAVVGGWLTATALPPIVDRFGRWFTGLVNRALGYLFDA